MTNQPHHSNSNRDALRDVITLLKQNGPFTYEDLVMALAAKLGITSAVARVRIGQFFAPETGAAMFNPSPPTIAQSIAAMKMRAAALRPRVDEKPLTHNIPVRSEHFLKFAPKPSASKWLKGAPEYVIGCYDLFETSGMRYTVALGGSMWTADYALANWRAGLDPRITPCLRMTSDPDCPAGESKWCHLLLSRRLGKKVKWFDLPLAVRTHVTLYVNTIRRSRDYR